MSYYTTPAAVIAISILFPILGIICVSLRFYTRSRAKVAFWIDDWLTIPALFLECVLAGLMIWGATTKSLGEHLPAPTEPGPDAYLFFESAQQIRLQQIQYFFDIIGVFAFGLLKLSMLFLYRKIFCPTGMRTTFDGVIILMIVMVITWTFAFGIGAIFLCGSHPSYAWAPIAQEAKHCYAQLPFLEAYAISDFIMDVIIWSLPIPKIWGLQMSFKQKLSILAVFLVGVLTIAASAARMAIYIIFVVNAFAQSDGEKIITYLLFWTMVELGLGLMVVCLPTFRGPLRSVFSNMSPGSILSGIKDVFTTRSLKSQDSNQPSVYGLDSVDHSGKFSSSHSKLYSPYDGAIQNQITGNRTLDRLEGSMNKGINVKKEVEQY